MTSSESETSSETQSSSDSESESTTVEPTCEEEPEQCMNGELLGAQCRSPGGESAGCWKCEEGENNCVPCEVVEACVGECVGGSCASEPCFGEGAQDTCEGGEACIGGTCEVASSCAELYEWGYRESGTYTIDVDGAGPLGELEVECVMGRECGGKAGGWTKLSFAQTAELERMLACETQNIGGDAEPNEWVVEPELNESYGPHAKHREWMGGDTTVGHTCRFSFAFPHKRFAFEGYEVGASCSNGTCRARDFELADWMKVWVNDQVDSGAGNIAWGTPSSLSTDLQAIAGDITCAGEFGSDMPIACLNNNQDAVVVTTEAGSCYENGEASRFQIGWGEFGNQPEGWAPWFGGDILLQ